MPAKITVIGLGSGDEDQLTLGTWKKLQSAKRIYLRTEKHPVVDMLRSNNAAYETFDDLYDENGTFSEVYEAIAAKLIELALTQYEVSGEFAYGRSEGSSNDGNGEQLHNSSEEIFYAVPGHPMVAEKTVQLLRRDCPLNKIELHIMGGESFLDQAFTRFGFDPIEGFQLLDASDMPTASIQPRLHTLVAQVYDTFTASDVKLSLMEVYPDDYPVVVGHALGVKGLEQIRTVPLYELDRIEGYGNLSLIWIPRTEQLEWLNRSFGRLQEIVHILRSPGGCPWDREQTHLSLRKNAIEELYEVLETIDDDDPQAMCEELGDLLLQVMLHAQIEDEAGTFNVYDVIQGLNEKLIRRHPHVFADADAGNAEEALVKWQEMKDAEKKAKGNDSESQSILAGVPRDLPGLMKAYKIQKKAASVGFDWESTEDVFHKLEEELAELKEAVQSFGKEEQKDELGDVIFGAVNLARFLNLDPEEALASTNRKFFHRFEYIEEKLRLKGRTFDQTSLIEMEEWWNEAKLTEIPAK
ncbi:MAG TPA: nucleoside triphosphate pyrophosphohydrolase [Bacilli bacterium]